MPAKLKAKRDTQGRANFLIAVFLMLSVILSFRLFTIQVLQHKEYKAMAQSQYWNLQEIPPSRGNILSSDGYFLAANKTAYLLFAEPKEVKDPISSARKISEIIVSSGHSSEEFAKTVSEFSEAMSSKLLWVALAHNLSLEKKEAILKLGIAGLGFENEPVRFYPERNLAAHVLGFVAKDQNGQDTGYFGIEGEYNGDLSGRAGRVVQELDAVGAPILVGGYKRVDPINGRDVTLAINRSIQYLVERRLKEGVEAYGAVSGSVIVMEPFSGDVITMANYPSYDPSNFNEEVEESTEAGRPLVQKRNLAISETYEPGSVAKAITISAAVDSGKITPQTTFVDGGPAVYSGHTIDNWDGKHYGTQTIIELLQKSNNIGAAWVAHLIGTQSLAKYFRAFGFGEKTNIGLEGEDTGTVREVKDWADIDLATAAFGQGISATPLQVLNAFNVIANGGNLVQPRIVTRMVGGGGRVIEMVPKKLKRVVSQETADTMVYLLTEAVSGGESKYFNIKKYIVAGKTGTAQIPVEGKYDPTKTNATFVGFLPESRKFTMIVRLDRPSTSPYAAETAVPLWMRIAEDLVKYYGIPPDK